MRMTAAASILSAVAISGGAAQDSSDNITTGALGNAKAIDNNPSGAQYIATLPATPFDAAAYPNGGNVQGSIQAVSMPDGSGVMFHVAFSNLPTTGGPFLYHIHSQPVPADGNCTKTLAHLDPYERGETPPCDASAPETCQVGDLSGKHGSINETGSYAYTYTDDYASTLSGIGAFFGNRSFVFHFANTTRITCANFTAVAAASCGGSSTTTTTAASTGTSSSTSTSTLTTTPTTSGATGTNATATSTSTPVTVNGGYANLPSVAFAMGAAAFAFLL